VTRQNAASAEQSSATAAQLSSQSGQLAGMVAEFRLDRADPTGLATRRAAASLQRISPAIVRA
jgi:hypothetical protein